MLFSRGFFPDARGHKEARDLTGAGYEVTILAWDRERRLASRQELDGFVVERLQLRALLGKGFAQLHRWAKFWTWAGAHPGAASLRHYPRQRSGHLAHRVAGSQDDRREARLRRAGAELLRLLVRPLYRASQTLERFLVLRSDNVLVCNEYQIGNYGSWGAHHTPSSRITRPWRWRPTSRRLFREWGGDAGRIGAIYQDTGIEEIVEAVQLLLARGRKVRLFLAGAPGGQLPAATDELLRAAWDKVELRGPFTPRHHH